MLRRKGTPSSNENTHVVIPLTAPHLFQPKSHALFFVSVFAFERAAGSLSSRPRVPAASPNQPGTTHCERPLMGPLSAPLAPVLHQNKQTLHFVSAFPHSAKRGRAAHARRFSRSKPTGQQHRVSLRPPRTAPIFEADAHDRRHSSARLRQKHAQPIFSETSPRQRQNATRAERESRRLPLPPFTRSLSLSSSPRHVVFVRVRVQNS